MVERATAGRPLNRSLSRRATAGWPFNRSVKPRDLDGNYAELVASVLWWESGLKLHVFVHLFFLLYLYFPASLEKRIEQLLPQSLEPTFSVHKYISPRIPALNALTNDDNRWQVKLHLSANYFHGFPAACAGLSSWCICSFFGSGGVLMGEKKCCVYGIFLEPRARVASAANYVGLSCDVNQDGFWFLLSLDCGEEPIL